MMYGRGGRSVIETAILFIPNKTNEEIGLIPNIVRSFVPALPGKSALAVENNKKWSMSLGRVSRESADLLALFCQHGRRPGLLLRISGEGDTCDRVGRGLRRL